MMLGRPDASLAGPILVALGLLGWCGAALFCRWDDVRRLHRVGQRDGPPTFRERLWVHLAVSGTWSLSFGIVVALGPAEATRAWDVRLPGEASWPVWQIAELPYVLGYLTPLLIAWIPRTREGLRSVAWLILGLTGISTVLFLTLPVAAPPRPFVATNGLGKLLEWETSRPDFAAASLPSFHALWGMLLARACRDRGPGWRRAGRAWMVVLSFACVANGAHAVADVAASWVLWITLTW